MTVWFMAVGGWPFPRSPLAAAPRHSPRHTAIPTGPTRHRQGAALPAGSRSIPYLKAPPYEGRDGLGVRKKKKNEGWGEKDYFLLLRLTYCCLISLSRVCKSSAS
jgi:hypothetical protein